MNGSIEAPRGTLNSEARKRREERAAERARQVREHSKEATKELAYAAQSAGDMLMAIAFTLAGSNGELGRAPTGPFILDAAERRVDLYCEAVTAFRAAWAELARLNGDFAGDAAEQPAAHPAEVGTIIRAAHEERIARAMQNHAATEAGQ